MLYKEIVDTALNYTDRATDPICVASIDYMLKLVEARINRFLKIQDTVTLATTIMDIEKEYYVPPADFSALKGIYAYPTDKPNDRISYTYLNPEQMENMVQSGFNSLGFDDFVTHSPAGVIYTQRFFYSYIGDAIHIHPKLDSTHTLAIWYFQQVPPLTSQNSSNWCSDKNPDCYVNGLVAEINAYAKDDNGFALWDKRFNDALNSMSFQDSVASWSGTPLTIKVG